MVEGHTRTNFQIGSIAFDRKHFFHFLSIRDTGKIDCPLAAMFLILAILVEIPQWAICAVIYKLAE